MGVLIDQQHVPLPSNYLINIFDNVKTAAILY